MQTTTSPQSASRTSTNRNAAFTFVEVMFATIILGIGLIMVAALLPVGMRQTTDTADRVTGRAIAENGFFTIQAVVNEDQVLVSAGGTADGYYPIGLPVTEQPTGFDDLGESIAVASLSVNSDDVEEFIHPFAGPLGIVLDFNDPVAVARFVSRDPDDDLGNFPAGPTNAIARTYGNRIITSDPRYAWIALHQRGFALGIDPISGARGLAPSNTATVTVFALKNQTGSTFTPADLWHPANQPHLFEVTNLQSEQLVEGVLTPAQITIEHTDITDMTPGMVTGRDYLNDDYTGDIDWTTFRKIDAVVSGSFVVIANDNIETDRLDYNDFEGVVVRLGRRLDNGSDPDVHTYELDPTFPLPVVNTPSGALPDGSDENPLAWVLGRQAVLAADGTVEGFEGGAMPVGFFQAKLPLQ